MIVTENLSAVKYRKCPACAHRIPSCLIAPPETGFKCEFTDFICTYLQLYILKSLTKRPVFIHLFSR
ncbi:unnamed protein product [Schistosoma mattheei]|uniref:Uncharacterized protein n=1 Tax=Schistosoma mattheei TaxID=31246 RepID=A0A183NNJ4_9TREM|nr:unnamed protein product [Schistosoma mattheei]